MTDHRSTYIQANTLRNVSVFITYCANPSGRPLALPPLLNTSWDRSSPEQIEILRHFKSLQSHGRHLRAQTGLLGWMAVFKLNLTHVWFVSTPRCTRLERMTSQWPNLRASLVMAYVSTTFHCSKEDVTMLREPRNIARTCAEHNDKNVRWKF